MNMNNFIKEYWDCVARQDEEKLREFFCEDAVIRWHNTNEQFCVDEFMRANCDYPGKWRGEVERTEIAGDKVITAAHIFTDGMSFHAVSFFLFDGDKIKTLDEYWGDDGEAPVWRAKKHIGSPIKV